MIRRPPRSTRTDTLFPYTTLFRSTIAVATLDDGFALDAEAAGGIPFAILTERQLFPERASQPRRRRRAGREPEAIRSEEHTSELQSLMRISYAVFCLNKKTEQNTKRYANQHKKRHT